MSSKRTTTAIEKAIQQLTSDLEALQHEKNQIVQQIAGAWGKDNTEAEARLPVIAARLEAGQLRLEDLQAELAAAGTTERLAEYEAMTQAAQAHYLELQALDAQITEQQEALQALQKQRSDMVAEYRQKLLHKRARLGAELAELVPGFDPGEMERKYSVPGYMG